MEIWNEIIQVAMIGTDKKSVNLLQFPSALQKQASLISQNTVPDREERFLQIAALASHAKRAGFTPYRNEAIVPLESPKEELPYASTAAHSLLKQIMEVDEVPILKVWLQHCVENRAILNPEWLPFLFEKGQQHRQLQPLLAACGGNRGAWICRYNETWKYSSASDHHEVWLHAGWEQRKEVFKELRKKNRSEALELVKQTWNTEDATTRLHLLEIVEQTCAKDDLAFLQNLQQDKSKKVKDKAMEIQKRIPESTPVSFYLQFMKEAFNIRKERSMLGMMSKTEIRFRIPTHLEAELFKTGVEKLSSEKGMSDEEFICYQVIECLPPRNWKEITGLDEESFIHLMQKDELGKKMIPALVLSIKRFRDLHWAQCMLEYSSVFYIDLIPLLEETTREQHCIKYLEKYPDNIIRYALSFEKEWSLELADKILKYTAGKPFQFAKSFYSEHIVKIPVGIAGHLGKYSPADNYLKTIWQGISDHLYSLLKLKHQTKQIFNA